ncbi:MAG: hypothetical protein FWG30_07365 [Eubacteriaceae bacterium]|nr:hypothetical protein [Eubacteriaceae bacterium]
MKKWLLLTALFLSVIAFSNAPKELGLLPTAAVESAKEWYVDMSGVKGIDLDELIDMASELPLAEKHALLESYGAVVTELNSQAEPKYTEYGLAVAAGNEWIFSPEQLEIIKTARNHQELCLPEEWYVNMGEVKGIDHDELIDMASELPLAEKHALLESYGAVITRIAPKAR